MKINNVSPNEKALLREKDNQRTDILNRVFYSARNIFVDVFEGKLEKIFEELGIDCQVNVKGDSRYERINMIFSNKNKKIERSLSLKRKSVGYTDFGKDVADVFLVLENISSGQYYPHRKPDFDTMIDNILNDEEFGEKIKKLVFSDFNYPFGEFYDFPEKMNKLKSEKDRLLFTRKIVESVEAILPLYYKNIIKEKINTKKYSLTLFESSPNTFLSFIESNKGDIFLLSVSFNKKEVSVNNIDFFIYEDVKVSSTLFKKSENNKKSIKAITKEFEDFCSENSLLEYMVNSLNNISYPYTYESRLSA